MMVEILLYIHVYIISQGILKGEDQCVNIILDNCQERIYSIDEGVKMDEIGVYLIRGDDMYVYSNYTLIVQL